LEEIKTGTPEENAQTIRGVFSGEITGPKRNVIVLNAAGALIVGGKAAGFAEGLALAGQLIDSGATAEKLHQLSALSNSFAG
jgi:anthranilate phosphoribosyltransferase